MFAKYFHYYTIIVSGSFFVDTLYNSIFNSTCVIKPQSVTLLMMLLKFTSKQRDILIYKYAKGNFSS